MVTIVATYGFTEKTFVLHEEVVYQHSPVLKAALSGSFVEGQSRIYRLEDTKHDTVRMLCKWLYSQQIETPFPIYDLSSVQLQAMKDYRRNLIDLWILADRLIIPSLQNTTITFLEKLDLGIYQKCKGKGSTYNVDDINHIFENTAHKSPLQFLCIKAQVISDDWEEERMDEITKKKTLCAYPRYPLTYWNAVAKFAVEQLSDASRVEIAVKKNSFVLEVPKREESKKKKEMQAYVESADESSS